MNGIEMKKKMYHSKKSIKKISTHIQKYLEDKNKIVFDFIYNNNKDEYQSFRNIYIHNIKSENLGKELNDRCQKFIDREIINYGKKNNIKISNINIDILNKLSNCLNIKIEFTKKKDISVYIPLEDESFFE